MRRAFRIARAAFRIALLALMLAVTNAAAQALPKPPPPAPPPKVCMPLPDYIKVDREFTRRGQAESDLKGQNQDLANRLAAEKDSGLGIKAALILIGVGFAAGVGTVVALQAIPGGNSR